MRQVTRFDARACRSGDKGSDRCLVGFVLAVGGQFKVGLVAVLAANKNLRPAHVKTSMSGWLEKKGVQRSAKPEKDWFQEASSRRSIAE